MGLPSFTAPHLNLSKTYVDNVEIQMENIVRGFRSQTAQISVISRCCFAEDG